MRYHGFMAAILSLILVGAALFILLRQGYDGTTVQWAIGIITLVTGLWLRAKD